MGTKNVWRLFITVKDLRNTLLIRMGKVFNFEVERMVVVFEMLNKNDRSSRRQNAADVWFSTKDGSVLELNVATYGLVGCM